MAGRTSVCLFAEDAAQGLGLIDLCNQHYDAVLMNPPFGYVPSDVAALLEAQYPNEKNDVYAAFVARANELLAEDGFVGAITSNPGLTLGHLESFRRRHLLGVHRVALLVDLGQAFSMRNRQDGDVRRRVCAPWVG